MLKYSIWFWFVLQNQLRRLRTCTDQLTTNEIDIILWTQKGSKLNVLQAEDQIHT